MRRYLFGLVVAYAATATLLASNWAVKAWFYKRWFEMLMRGKHGRPIHFSGLSAVARDFGMELSPWDVLALRFADLPAQFLVLSILFIFALCLGIAALMKVQGPGSPQPLGEDTSGSLNWVRRWTMASLIVGTTTFLLTWAYIRWRVLHPHYLPTVLLFLALILTEIIALGLCSWRLMRGPRRFAALGLMVAALAPVVLWGCIGRYAWANWRQRLVPNTLPMNLAKMAATSPMRLEASIEYPNRLETDRLLMVYDRLERPHQDAEAMDRHLARMEGMLGGPLRSKVYWVRGHLKRLDLGNLSVHGIALGSGESPADWDEEGRLDRHELAHAVLDEYRPHDADPPYFLHEGWAESQSGVGPVVLARSALEQRSSNPSLGLREMASPGWYHRDDGPVYPLGGAFVDHLIRIYGVKAFLKLYQECRPGTFEAKCREILGADFDVLEAKFWDDVQRQVGGSA
jgi:hypothetical protein